MLEPEIDAGTAVVTLASQLNYAACAELHDQIARLRGTDLRLDASNVRYLGGMALDLLLRLQAEWRDAGLTFAVCHASTGLVQSLATLGLDPGHLGIGPNATESAA